MHIQLLGYFCISTGITALVRLLNSAGEEAQPGLTVLLCEILTAVYLSLFIHGLATHSSSELYRIMTHPLNNKMWSAIFGGGAHTPIKGQQQLKTKTGMSFFGGVGGGAGFLLLEDVFTAESLRLISLKSMFSSD